MCCAYVCEASMVSLCGINALAKEINSRHWCRGVHRRAVEENEPRKMKMFHAISKPYTQASQDNKKGDRLLSFFFRAFHVRH